MEKTWKKEEKHRVQDSKKLPVVFFTRIKSKISLLAYNTIHATFVTKKKIIIIKSLNFIKFDL